MPAGSLLLLLDDIASVLDNVAVMTQVAASKAAAVVGDDLAVNAHQLSGLAADRELRVVWAVGRGSLGNKLILVPTAILLSAFAPWSVVPLLVVGGCYLCFEGAEKLAHRWLRPPRRSSEARGTEAERIRGAIRTDFVLSAEIIIITLGAVSGAALPLQLGVLLSVGFLMTVGVYGLVAAIVKMDDVGLYLTRTTAISPWGAASRGFGRALVNGAPWLMRFLAVAGTLAMLLVGGGILIHGVPPLHAVSDVITRIVGACGLPPSVRDRLSTILVNATVGLAVGTSVLGVVSTWRRAKG